MGVSFNRILFVSFHNLHTDSGLYPLCALATYIRPFVEAVSVCDAIRQNLQQRIEEFKPDMIAVPSYTVHHDEITEYVRQIKETYPNIKFVIGGYHITAMPDSFGPPYDYAVLGEGEETLKKIVTGTITPLDHVIIAGKTRIVTDNKNAVDVENLPVVDLPSLTPPEFYLHGKVGMVTSRGCSFDCKYCAIRAMSKGVRHRKVDIVVDEIYYYYSTLRVSEITFWDDIFGLNVNWLTEFIAALKKRQLLGKIKYAIHVRANTVNEKRCQLWKELGVFKWNMGLDSGSDAVLKRVKGGASSCESNKNAILLGSKYGFEIGGSIILGGPDETLEEMEESIAFLKWFGDQKHIERTLHPTSNMWGFVASPLPSTEWWDWGIANGRFTKDIDLRRLSLDNWDDHLLLRDDITNEQFNDIRNKAEKELTRIYPAPV
jgi:anaerobic magnesium-protoporphyrin IX monomethyl ester cyclase